MDPCDTSICSTQGHAYDIESLMHGDNYANAKQGLWSMFKKGDPTYRIGHKKDFSAGDIKDIKALYCGSGEYIVIAVRHVMPITK